LGSPAFCGDGVAAFLACAEAEFDANPTRRTVVITAILEEWFICSFHAFVC